MGWIWKITRSSSLLGSIRQLASSSGGRLNNWRAPVGVVGDPGYVAGGWEGDGGSGPIGLRTDERDRSHMGPPYLETITSGGVAFPNWTAFEEAFRKRFAPLDSAQSARDMLKTIKQGRDRWLNISQIRSILYAYWVSDADHRQRFYDGLDDRVKDLFAPVNGKSNVHGNTYIGQ